MSDCFTARVSCIVSTSAYSTISSNSSYGVPSDLSLKPEITTGISEDLFAPEANVTREQIVTFLARYAKLTGSETEGDLSAFPDADQVSAYAVDAIG